MVRMGMVRIMRDGEGDEDSEGNENDEEYE